LPLERSVWIRAGITGNGNPGLRTGTNYRQTEGSGKVGKVARRLFLSLFLSSECNDVAVDVAVAVAVAVTIAIATRMFCVCGESDTTYVDGEIYIYIYIVYLHV
jgi:hypothetical protein